MPFTYFPVSITATEQGELADAARRCRHAIITMTTLAASGHPGGSMSSIDVLLTLYKYANINHANSQSPDRDKIFVSIGHISPAVYSTLAINNFFPLDDVISTFRLAGSSYQGHIERYLPGVEWTTGNLGQGLAAACGAAVADRIKNVESSIYVLMGDGEQQKGQISEAIRFAAKFKLNNITAIIDYNGLQISGSVGEVMPQDLIAEYRAGGWEAFECDGHNYNGIVAAIHKAQQIDKPVMLLANTTMGRGVSFMENQNKYHGAPLSKDDYVKAVKELGFESELDKYSELRAKAQKTIQAGGATNKKDLSYKVNLHAIPQKLYATDIKTDCRSAYGDALAELARGATVAGATPIAVFDCDLASSVKTANVAKNFPNNFFQCGISEHHAAAMAGAVSAYGVIPFFSTFTMFAVDEVYNQLRMNDINCTNLKVVSTHAGVDVGEDGLTHQCVDYLGLMRNIFGFKVLAPADPNQTYRLIDHVTRQFGNYHVVMGRSALPIITDDSGKPYYDDNYKFKYSALELIRKGQLPLVAFGGMLYRALEARELVGEDKIAVYNAPTPAYINRDEILALADAGIIFTYEDHYYKTGLYATICEVLASAGKRCNVVPFGIEGYSYSGKPDDLLKLMGLDSESVANKIKGHL
ncbi:transketolase [Deferribacterales bacterium RsTz2092]|nr:transketolase [Deferribacterales bacterium]